MRRRITHVRTSSFASPSQRPPSEGRSRPSLPQVPPGCRLWPAQSPCFSGAGSPVLDSLRCRHRSALRPPRPGVLNYQHVISVHLQRNWGYVLPRGIRKNNSEIIVFLTFSLRPWQRRGVSRCQAGTLNIVDLASFLRSSRSGLFLMLMLGRRVLFNRSFSRFLFFGVLSSTQPSYFT